MSWAYGVDENGREVGYGVRAQCDEPGCLYWIDRGLAYRCGGTMQLHGGPGCGGFFCEHHLFHEVRGDADDDWSPQMCNACCNKWLVGEAAR